MGEDNSLLSILKEIHKSDATMVENRLITFRTNYFVFHRNYEELKKILASANKNQEAMLEVWSMENRDQLDILNNEISRLLLNFLASAKALVSQTRVLIKHWYKSTDFAKEYQKRVNKVFVNNELVSFIEDLRNYSLHYALPFASAAFRAFSSTKEAGKLDSLDFSFNLNKNGLLLWAGWKKYSKSYLEKANEDIRIESFVDEYYSLVNEFHLWMGERLKEIHSDEIQWLANKRKEARDMMTDEEKRIRGIPIDD